MPKPYRVLSGDQWLDEQPEPEPQPERDETATAVESEVVRLAGLSAIKYEQERKAAAEALGLRAATAPFYGLQEVLVIKCGASEGTDALLEAARKECRSTHFVLVDAYQNLPDDFMMRALATPRDGKSSVLGYRVYSRH